MSLTSRFTVWRESPRGHRAGGVSRVRGCDQEERWDEIGKTEKKSSGLPGFEPFKGGRGFYSQHWEKTGTMKGFNMVELALSIAYMPFLRREGLPGCGRWLVREGR